MKHEVTAKYIHTAIVYRDCRIVIVGIPIKVGKNSVYDVHRYKEISEVLKLFGFQPVGKPYKNSNSKNTMIAMVCKGPF